MPVSEVGMLGTCCGCRGQSSAIVTYKGALLKTVCVPDRVEPPWPSKREWKLEAGSRMTAFAETRRADVISNSGTK